MESLWLDLELVDDAAITQTSATVGGHQSLGYLPGAVLLGAAAGSYPAADPAQAFRWFHSGEVRFGPGLPLGADGAAAVPIPFSLHRRKGGDDSTLVNLARAEREPGVQYQQERRGFLDGALRRVVPAFRSSMRTAVGEGGRAREGFLYGITAIARGTRFRARVDADAAADLDHVRAALVGQVIRIGRSRSAEFGRARVGEAAAAEPPAWSPGPPGQATFLCLSDLALRDRETGQPALEPDPAALGLPGWRWSAERSFLRFRTYSPFNSYRARPDLERQVIAAGSVLVFERAGQRPDVDRVRAAIEPGVGQYRAEGLGQVAFEPAVLREAQVTLAAAPGEARRAVAVSRPAGELGEWLTLREAERAGLDDSWDRAMDMVEKLARVSIPAAQWGEVRALAARRRQATASELADELKAFLVEPPGRDDRRSVRHGERRWGRRMRVDGKSWKAGEWLAEQIRGTNHPAQVLELLAIHVVREQRAREAVR
jgi:hypothetical protein